mmetsp:Transcript_18891/g.48054  ORF Transcript_18891/g.48054 Transcript_18891/m.48054 type:complete len:452 (-) Transcript_18891:2438-3793(-)
MSVGISEVEKSFSTTPDEGEAGTILRSTEGDTDPLRVRSRDEEFFVDYFALAERNMLRFKLASSIGGVVMTGATLGWRKLFPRSPRRWTMPRATAGVLAITSYTGWFMSSTVEEVAEMGRNRGVGLRCVAWMGGKRIAGALKEGVTVTPSSPSSLPSSEQPGTSDSHAASLDVRYEGGLIDAHYFMLDPTEGKTMFGGQAYDPLRYLLEMGLAASTLQWIRDFIAVEGEEQRRIQEEKQQERRDAEQWKAVMAERNLDVGTLVVWKVPVVVVPSSSSHGRAETGEKTRDEEVAEGSVIDSSDKAIVEERSTAPSWFWRMLGYTSNTPPSSPSPLPSLEGEGSEEAGENKRSESHGDEALPSSMVVVGVFEGESQYRSLDYPQAPLLDRLLDPSPPVSRNGLPLPPCRIVKAEVYKGHRLANVPPFDPVADDPTFPPPCPEECVMEVDHCRW